MVRIFVLILAAAASAVAADFDHVVAIKSLDAGDIARGQKLYTQHCVACHGADGNQVQNPLARRFAQDELKFGADPYALWKTTSYGNGLMFRWDAVLTEKQRYEVVHYIREQFLRKNGSQHVTPDAAYFAELPARADADARAHAQPMPDLPIAPGMIDGKMGKAMRYGPAQSHSVMFRQEEDSERNDIRFKSTTEKAMIIAVGPDAVMSYDTERMSVAGVWPQKFADTSETHHTSYKGGHGLMPGGAPMYVDTDAEGWRIQTLGTPSAAGTVAFLGHYLHRDQVVLAYTVGGRRVLDLPGLGRDRGTFSRTLEIAPGNETLFALVGRIAGGTARISGSTASVAGGGRQLHAAISATGEGMKFHGDATGALWLELPASTTTRRCTVSFGFDAPIAAEGLPGSPDVAQLINGGPRRWPQAVKTSVVRGKSIDGYAADELLVPFANPWGSWMRLTALDFFADGRIAVSTLSGDVWIVTAKGDELSWSRFANGLYEPLGLRIVDDTIYVRGRDRIVRLRDLNHDGEADFHESFYNEPGEIGAGYHAFIFELQTDKAGNFYYSKSGRKTPHKAAVVRLSPDGKRAETIAGDFRHPNGMGAGGPRDWITVADNPSGNSVYSGVALVREGASHGYERPRNTPMLAILPATVDASSTGQSWSDPTRWGPLSGSLLHTSYSHCAMFYISVQDVGAHPNGFAIRLPFGFKAGLMRSRVHPIDRQVYTVGLKGWDTHAAYDGCLYRIRFTGEPTRMIQSVAATRAGLRLTFACDLDPRSIGAQAVTAAREQNKKGELGPVALGAITLATPRTLEVALPQIEDELVERRTTTDRNGNVTVAIRSPITLTVAVKSADGAAISQIVYATINSLP